MLELRQIVKEYQTGAERVEALQGVDLQFRNHEFVAILGPSGCGKTTMLNIIGGLDQYTSGDLVINEKSTRDFRDRDWDTYRNHSVGFVFQSYNLIPHQSVLHNVELALTLSGVPRRLRREKAKAALERVGLGDQLRKKPNEMSGGQMQRVAIARAIVNDPDIILADEPTGALDTETSLQVMDILREIARDRLVVMVTHNPELAQQYATRIVRMLDGRITHDSQPLMQEEILDQRKRSVSKDGMKKPSMSVLTSFGLSLKNLFTKKGRTLLTSFAGSIGIIGIALIYAISHGMTQYINTVQEQTLSSYPLTIQAQTVDLTSLLTNFMGKAESTTQHENDAIYEKAMFYDMLKALDSVETQENDLKAFKQYIIEKRADPENVLSQAIRGVQYSYTPEMTVYTKNRQDEIVRSDTQTMMRELLVKYMGRSKVGAMSQSGNAQSDGMSSMRGSMFGTQSNQLWQEILPGDNGQLISDVIQQQYELVYGAWPARYDEVVLFLDEHNELNDLTLYALGLKTQEEMDALFEAMDQEQEAQYTEEKWDYADICSREYRTVLAADCFSLDPATGTYTDLRETEAGLKYLYDQALPLHVVGIVRPDEDAVSANHSGSIGYTQALTQYIIEKAWDTDAVKAQQADETVDIFTGLPFAAQEEFSQAEKAQAFAQRIRNMTVAQKADLYAAVKSIPDEEAVNQAAMQTLTTMDRQMMLANLSQSMGQQMGMDQAQVEAYLAAMSEEEINALLLQAAAQQYRNQYAQQMEAALADLTEDEMARMLTEETAGYTDAQKAACYDRVLEFSDSTYEDNLIRLGCADLDVPSAINLYAASFEDKDLIEAAIAEYNETVDDLEEIHYTDYVGLIMSSVTTIIDAITNVLIAFVAVSLVVSSIMVGVITLISVQERTKEIGILRAIGASKRNVSSMFMAETVIIGFAAGTLGVTLTYLLCIPINAIVQSVTGIRNLHAALPVQTALILILISVLLTLIAGIIPSRSAARKDPVVALRTE